MISIPKPKKKEHKMTKSIERQKWAVEIFEAVAACVRKALAEDRFDALSELQINCIAAKLRELAAAPVDYDTDDIAVVLTRLYQDNEGTASRSDIEVAMSRKLKEWLREQGGPERVSELWCDHCHDDPCTCPPVDLGAFSTSLEPSVVIESPHKGLEEAVRESVNVFGRIHAGTVGVSDISADPDTLTETILAAVQPLFDKLQAANAALVERCEELEELDKQNTEWLLEAGLLEVRCRGCNRELSDVGEQCIKQGDVGDPNTDQLCGIGALTATKEAADG